MSAYDIKRNISNKDVVFTRVQQALDDIDARIVALSAALAAIAKIIAQDHDDVGPVCRCERRAKGEETEGKEEGAHDECAPKRWRTCRHFFKPSRPADEAEA